MNNHFKIVEKNNLLAVHALFSTLDSAERWLKNDAVIGCQRGYFMDKTLTPDSFKIIIPATYKAKL